TPLPHPPTSPPFPYTTLFRSSRKEAVHLVGDARDPEDDPCGPAVAPLSRDHQRHEDGDQPKSADRERVGDPGQRSGYDARGHERDRKSTRLNSSHVKISYAVF